MKSLLISLLIIAVLLVLYLRPWTRQGDGPSQPSQRFMRQCATVYSERPAPDGYCRCLWDKGVRSPKETLMKPAARAAAAACD